jgi:hypothetical protein
LQYLAKHQIADNDLVLAHSGTQDLNVGALRPLRKSIQTLLSTTITLSRDLRGSAPSCPASDTFRTRHRPAAAAAA